MRVARRACSSEWARAKDVVEDARIQADAEAACHHALGARWCGGGAQVYIVCVCISVIARVADVLSSYFVIEAHSVNFSPTRQAESTVGRCIHIHDMTYPTDT